MALAENHLIALLPRADRLRLLAACEAVPLRSADVLYEPGETTRYAYFPTDGFVSLVTRSDVKPGLEVGMVGREGMLGAHLALGVVTAPLHALVQGPGEAWRIEAVAFGRELTSCTTLQDIINRYLYVLMAQLAASSACMRFHLVGPRLARWLLMSQDRARSDSFRMTHEFLAYMLGVRRVGITTAASAFARSGLIAYHHGDITVLDRNGLEAAACSCYAADCRNYASQMSGRAGADTALIKAAAIPAEPLPIHSRGNPRRKP